ncbi:MAG: hypothetical protein AAF602_16120 [Myxococcota bacterium]
MLDWYPSLALVAAETHRCSVTGPLPEPLLAAIRRFVPDNALRTDIIAALHHLVRHLGHMPSAPPSVDVEVRATQRSLELAIQQGSIREMLVCTLG